LVASAVEAGRHSKTAVIKTMASCIGSPFRMAFYLTIILFFFSYFALYKQRYMLSIRSYKNYKNIPFYSIFSKKSPATSQYDNPCMAGTDAFSGSQTYIPIFTTLQHRGNSHRLGCSSPVSPCMIPTGTTPHAAGTADTCIRLRYNAGPAKI
jgi:hypothetical protein